MTKKKVIYRDLDLNFGLHPITKDVTQLTDNTDIIRSLHNLIKTMNFERPFHPEIGCQIYSLLFEQLTDGTLASMRRTIEYTITNFEPRVSLEALKIAGSGHSIVIDLQFKIVATGLTQTASFTLERTL